MKIGKGLSRGIFIVSLLVLALGTLEGCGGGSGGGSSAPATTYTMGPNGVCTSNTGQVVANSYCPNGAGYAGTPCMNSAGQPMPPNYCGQGAGPYYNNQPPPYYNSYYSSYYSPYYYNQGSGYFFYYGH